MARNGAVAGYDQDKPILQHEWGFSCPIIDRSESNDPDYQNEDGR